MRRERRLAAAQRGILGIGLALVYGAVAAGLLATLTFPRVPVWPAWLSTGSSRPGVTVTVGSARVEAELARTAAEEQRGLGYRDGLRPGTGMLFVYHDADYRTFWMKGMRFCLDIVWIQDGAVAGAAERVCPSPPGTRDADLPIFRSPRPVTYVFEVPAGWLRDHGLGAGSPVTFTPAPETLAGSG